MYSVFQALSFPNRSRSASTPEGLLAGAAVLLTFAVIPSPASAQGRTQARAAALESVRVTAGQRAVSFKTPLDAGELFLLKATGTIRAGADSVDAEYGGDMGVDVGVPAQDTLSGAAPPRSHWFGGHRADHTYYMIVSGAGRPLTLRLITGGGRAGPGAITVSMFRLSPTPAMLSQPLEALQVPVLERTVATSMATRPSTVYLLQASGSGRVGGGGLGQGDAEYMDYKADGAGAVDIGDAHTDYGLGVDEADQSRSPRLHKWGAWRKDHTYYMLFAGTSNPIHFFFYDVKGGYGDNSPTDTLAVKIFPVP